MVGKIDMTFQAKHRPPEVKSRVVSLKQVMRVCLLRGTLA